MENKYPWQAKQTKRRDQRRYNPFARKTQALPIKKKKYRIKPVADSSKAELAIYKILEKDFLKDNPICQCNRNGCRRRSTEVHHKKGRGIYLNVVEFFLAVNRICHRWIEDHPKEAKELGLSLSRLAK